MSYSPVIGRWLEQDPAGYVDGMNLYEGFTSRPVSVVDPMGTAVRLAPLNGIVDNRSTREIQVTGDYVLVTQHNPLPGNLNNWNIWRPTHASDLNILRRNHEHDGFVLREEENSEMFWIDPGKNSWSMRLNREIWAVDVDFVVGIIGGKVFSDRKESREISLSLAANNSNPGKVGYNVLVVKDTDCGNGVYFETELRVRWLR